MLWWDLFVDFIVVVMGLPVVNITVVFVGAAAVFVISSDFAALVTLAFIVENVACY